MARSNLRIRIKGCTIVEWLWHRHFLVSVYFAVMFVAGGLE